MMSTLWTVAAVCLCLGGHPCSETSELKKAIVRMQDLYLSLIHISEPTRH